MDIDVLGHKIFCDVKGSGQECVLLHGWGTDSSSLKGVSNYLSNYYKVYSIDFLGFGKSSKLTNPMTVEDYAKVTMALFEKLGLQKPVLIGHSFGCRVITYLVTKLNFDADKLVFTGGAGIKPKHSPIYLAKLHCYKITRKLVSKLYKKEKADIIIENMRKKRGSADYNAASPLLRETLVSVVNEDLKPLIAQIDNKTLLLWGENDDATPLADAKTMLKLIKHSKLVVLKACGHYAFLDKPFEFNSALEKFLLG